MKWRPAENSLFAILLRSPFWISFAVAGGVFSLARLFLPAGYAIVVALPFIGVGAVRAWRQLTAPSAKAVTATIEAVRAMSWAQFLEVLEAAYRREGASVRRLSGGEADLELIRGERVTLVSGKRWKVARPGVEPLRDLAAARASNGAQEAVFVATGELTDNARAFAKENRVAVLEGAALAALLRGMLPPAKS